MSVETLIMHLADTMASIETNGDDTLADNGPFNELWRGIVNACNEEASTLLGIHLVRAKKAQDQARLAREARWSPRDQREALDQGWGIFDAKGMCIEAALMPKRFDNDAAAWAWVAGRIQQDELCKKAIDHIYHHRFGKRNG